MSPAFAEKMAAVSASRRRSQSSTRRAVPALYWRSSNLGRWATLESFATLLSYKDEIREVMEFCLDEQSALLLPGSGPLLRRLLRQGPGFAGGDMKKAAAHFNVAIDAHPDYCGTRILMAEEWAIKEDNRPLFEELVDYVLAGRPERDSRASPGEHLRAAQGQQAQGRDRRHF